MAALVQLSPVLDIRAAGPLAAELLALRGNDVVIEGADVVHLGTQCLQVLLAARATWRDDEAAMDVVNPSPELIECLNLLGVQPETLLR
jgi:chemotaxis protein CheX